MDSIDYDELVLHRKTSQEKFQAALISMETTDSHATFARRSRTQARYHWDSEGEQQLELGFCTRNFNRAL